MKVDVKKFNLAMANACMNLEDVALNSKVSRTSIGRFLSGKTEPRPKTLGKIAKALKVPVENLIDMEGGV